MGLVLLGAGAPIVRSTVDGTGLLNDAHLAWHTALAEAAGTTLGRVAVYGVHRHNAPPVCPAVAALVAQQKDRPRVFGADFFQRCLDAGRISLKAAIPQA